MIEIYLYGCNCGVTAALIRKVSRFAQRNFLNFALYHTKYDKEMLAKHAQLIKSNGIREDKYVPLVVYNGVVKELSAWTE